MKLRHFVSGSAVILAGWLALTFVYHMPAQRYLNINKSPTAALPASKPMAGQDSSGTAANYITVSHLR